MTSQTLIEQLREGYQIEPFVMDFLEIWAYIHEEAQNHTIETALEFCQEIWKTHTKPFYKKYQKYKEIDLVESWAKKFASITIAYYDRGQLLFPLELLKYELYNKKENIIQNFIQKIILKENEGDIKSLVEVMMPAILSVKVLITKDFIQLLKAFQTINKQHPYRFQPLSNKEIAKYLKLSYKTVQRKVGVVELLQMVNTVHFIDMAQLGYETYLIVHRKPIPKKYERYFQLSAGYHKQWVSIIQIHIMNTRILAEMTKELDIKDRRMIKKRVQSWNLSKMTEDGWKGVALSVDPRRNVIREKYDLDQKLKQTDIRFRKLTRADIKILDFYTKMGEPGNISNFSKAIKVSRMEITKRLGEYSDQRLVQNVTQYYNVGLNSILCFISDNNKERKWEKALSLFPKADIFYDRSQEPNVYFCHFKMPQQWFQQFYQKMDKMKEEKGINYQAKPSSSTDHFKWGISLAETYPMEEN